MGDLDNLINRATNPNNVYEDWKAIVTLSDHLNKDAQAIPNAVRLLSHKMQSPQEKEALYALRTLEACAQRCGPKFHSEIGKFRFLNELIKMLSPKYLGARTSDTVKRRVVEIMRSWNTQIKVENKIGEAYAMLQRNGFIRDGSAENAGAAQQSKGSPNRAASDPNAAKKKHPSIFENDEKSKTLAALLKSRNPADLIAANRLIKTMLKEDAEHQDRLVKRDVELETVANNVKLLNEMISSFEKEAGRTSEVEIVRELEATLQRCRPQLVKLASETDERDTETISLICKMGDDVTAVLARCSSVVGSQLLDTVVFGDSASGQSTAPTLPTSAGQDVLSLGADLQGLDIGASAAAPALLTPSVALTPSAPPAAPVAASTVPAGPQDVSLLDLDFGFAPPAGLNGAATSTLSPGTTNLLNDVFRDALSGAPASSMRTGNILGPIAAAPTTASQPGFVPPVRAGGYTSLAALRTPGSSTAPSNSTSLAQQPALMQSPFAELEFMQKTLLTKPQTSVAAEPSHRTLLDDDSNSLLSIAPSEQLLASVPAPVLLPIVEQKRTVLVETCYLEYTERSGVSTRPCSTSELLPPLRIEVSDVVPSGMPSKCVLDCESVRLMLHFTDNRPEPVGSRLLVLALTSYSTSRVSNVHISCSTLVKLERETNASEQNAQECLCTFQCAAYRLLAMSEARELAAFNPLVPPATTTYALHVGRASDARCSACQREPDAPFGRCVKLRVAFDTQAKRFEQLVNLADFV